MDSSESAKTFLFEKQKAFVLGFSTQLAALKVTGWTLEMRMAALQYSSYVSVEQRFSAWKDLDSFHSSVNAMSYIGHGTYTTYAITNASQMLVHETPPHSVRLVLLMTDGVDHPRNPDVIAAAAEAKDHGIKFFTVGLSDIAEQNQNKAKLRAVASAPAKQFVHSLLDVKLSEKLLKEMVSTGFNEKILVCTTIHIGYQHTKPHIKCWLACFDMGTSTLFCAVASGAIMWTLLQDLEKSRFL